VFAPSVLSVYAHIAHCTVQGFCAGLEFKADLNKTLNFKTHKKAWKCFWKCKEGLRKFEI